MKDKTEQRQRAFNRVVAGLAGQQWRKSVNDNGTCVYYNARTGDRCAIGHLIAEHYTPYMTGLGVYADSIQEALHASGHNPRIIGAGFLSDLQHAHDSATDAASMIKKMAVVASEFQLQCPFQLGQLV